MKSTHTSGTRAYSVRFDGDTHAKLEFAVHQLRLRTGVPVGLSQTVRYAINQVVYQLSNGTLDVDAAQRHLQGQLKDARPAPRHWPGLQGLKPTVQSWQRTLEDVRDGRG